MLTLTAHERTTPTFETTLVDDDGVGVPGSTLDAIYLTLFDEASGTILNARDHVSVLGGDVEVGEDGVLTWTMDAADTAIVNDALAEEWHVAHFDIGWTVGAASYVSRLAIRIIVENMAQVPAAPEVP